LALWPADSCTRKLRVEEVPVIVLFPVFPKRNATRSSSPQIPAASLTRRLFQSRDPDFDILDLDRLPGLIQNGVVGSLRRSGTARLFDQIEESRQSCSK
jgi:hypothetical protein